MDPDDHRLAGLRPVRVGQPVVALDFDGVVNALCRPGREPPGYSRHRIWLHAATWPAHDWLAPVSPPGQHTSIVLNPQHADFIAQLQQAGAHVVWASAWEHALLPHLRLAGLPRLPVVPFSLLAGRRKFSDPMTWKLHGFAQTFAADTPLAFVDDAAWSYRRTAIGPHGGAFKVIAPDEQVGLTRPEQDTLLQWIVQHPDP